MARSISPRSVRSRPSYRWKSEATRSKQLHTAAVRIAFGRPSLAVTTSACRSFISAKTVTEAYWFCSAS